jgi:hypothetical protein
MDARVFVRKAEEGCLELWARLSCSAPTYVIGKLRARPVIFWEYDRCKGAEE